MSSRLARGDGMKIDCVYLRRIGHPDGDEVYDRCDLNEVHCDPEDCTDKEPSVRS